MKKTKEFLHALRDDPRYIPLPYLAMTILMAIALFAVYQREISNDRQTARGDRRNLAINAWIRYDQGLAACRRANMLRDRLRSIDKVDDQIGTALVDLLGQTVELTMAINQKDIALDAARLKRKVDAVLANRAKIVNLDCATVIKQPSVPRPATGGVG